MPVGRTVLADQKTKKGRGMGDGGKVKCPE